MGGTTGTGRTPNEPLRRYTRQVIEWIAIVGFAGIIMAIVGVAAAIVYHAWTL